MIETVPADGDVTVTVYAELNHRCPFVDELDRGDVKLTWRVAGQSFELHSLRQYLDSYADARLSHEDVTDRIRHDLSTVPGVELIEVATGFDTAGMDVKCSTSPTHHQV